MEREERPALRMFRMTRLPALTRAILRWPFLIPLEKAIFRAMARFLSTLLVINFLMTMQIGNYARGTGLYRTGRDALTKTEYAKTLEVARDFEDIALIRLAVAGGLRREDIVHVELKNINFSDNSISFYEHKKKKIHTIFILPDLMRFLETYIRTIPKGQIKLFDMSSKTAYNRFQRLLVKAGLKKRPFHSLRATCIKFCQASGWTPSMTAAHVDDTVATIQEHYEVPSMAEMKEVAEKRGFA